MSHSDQGASEGRKTAGAGGGAGEGWPRRLAPYAGRVALAAALVAAVAGASVWAAGRPTPRRVEILIPTPTAPAPVKVHVAGAVRQPGVYTLAPGARIEDAVSAAVPLPGADVHALNLAAPLTDGARIEVPQLPPGTEEAVGAAAEEGAHAAEPAPPAPHLIDLNTATAEQLQEIDGIGPVRAQAIIEYRRLHGPIERVDELLDIHGIGEKTVEAIRRRVVQP